MATLLVSLGLEAYGDEKPFRALAASEYPHQSAEQVTVGAKAYDSDELVTEAFKKANLLKFGVLPVLVVIENKRGQSLSLQNMEVSLVGSDNRHVTAIGPDEVMFLGTNGKHDPQKKVQLPVPLPKKKNPLNAPEIVTRAFLARMLAPGDTASGFFYFEAQPEKGDSLYLSGIRNARSGKEVMYFEFPLEKQDEPK